MYSIVVFVVVLLTQIGAVLNASNDQAVADASAGWTHRVDVNGTLIAGQPGRRAAVGAVRRAHRRRHAAGDRATTTATDPGHRTTARSKSWSSASRTSPRVPTCIPLDQRLAGFDDDQRSGPRSRAIPSTSSSTQFFGRAAGHTDSPSAPVTRSRSPTRRPVLTARQDHRRHDVDRRAPSTTSASASSASRCSRAPRRRQLMSATRE